MKPFAFHAYLSTNVPAYSAVHYIIAFDKVVTNVGNGYHSNLGTFITPRSGLCVFTWTIRQWGSRYQKTKLVFDNKVAHVIHMHPDNGVDSSVTDTKPKLAFSPLEKSPYEFEFTSSLRTFYTEMRTAIIRSKR